MTYPIYLYNTTSETLVFNDIGLELPTTEFFKVEDEDYFYSQIYKNEMKLALEQERVVAYRTDVNFPPLSSDKVSLKDIGINILDCGNSDSIYFVENVIDCGVSNSEYQRNDLINCGRSI